MCRTRNFGAVTFLLSASLAFAAGSPSLEVQSPAQNSIVRGSTVKIEFRTHDFKIVSLKNLMLPDARSARVARIDDESRNPAPTIGVSPEEDASRSRAGIGPNYGGPSSGSLRGQPNKVEAPSQPPPNPHEGFVVAEVDDSPYFIFHTTNDPFMLVFQQPGQHRVTLQLMTDDGRPAGQPSSLAFTVTAVIDRTTAPEK